MKAGAYARVLPLGIDRSAFVRGTTAGSWTVVDISAPADKAEALVREFVPSFIYQLPREKLSGGETLFNLFEDSRVNSWWFLEISEKSPLRGRLINQLYFLALIRAVVERGGFDEIWLDLEDSSLAKTVCGRLGPRVIVRDLSAPSRRLVSRLVQEPLLRYPVFAAGTYLLHVARYMILCATGLARQQPVDDAVAFFSFYPAWWSRPYETNATDRFFERLPDVIRRRAPICYAVWLTAGPITLWRRRRAIREFVCRHKVVLLQSALGLRAASKALSLRYWRRLIRFRFSLSRRINGEFAGFPIGKLMAEEIGRSMSAAEFFMDIMISRAFERLTGQARLRAVIYRTEFQPFEKAILSGIRGKTLGIAFQHSTFGRNYLPYFFVPGELKGYNDGSRCAMPLPDLLLTTGWYAREVMVNNGFDSNRVEVCGPVRYARLLEYCRSQRPREEIRRNLGLDLSAVIFLVASSVVREGSWAMLVALRQALETLPVLPYIVFNSHPAMRLDSEFHEQVGKLLRADGCRVLASDTLLHDYLAASDGIILTGTTVGVEAMLLGVVPVVFESRFVFDAKSMSEVAEACLVVNDAAGLSSALRQIMEHDAHIGEVRAYWDSAISRMFDRIDADPNERFAQILAKHGLVP